MMNCAAYVTRRGSHCLRLAIALTLTAAATGAAAQPDTSEWKCEQCPFETGYRADYTLGGSYVSDDAARFGDATGYDEKGGYVEADGAGRYTNDGYRMDWILEDLGLDSRFAELEGGHQGTYEYRLAYRQLPHHVFDTTRTIYGTAGSDLLILPADWVRSGTTAGFTALDTSLMARDIESERKVLEIGGRYLPTSNFEIFAEYARQERDGLGITSGSFYTQGNLLPRPFDYQTDSADVGLRLRSERGFVTLAYYGSFFQDQASVLAWENAFIGPDLGALAQPPDNNFQQLSLSGSYRLAFDTVIAASAGLGRAEQDDALPGYTVNPTLSPSPLPRSSLDGQVDTTNLALTITSQPIAIARVKLAYRYDERENETPLETWEPVIVDTLPAFESPVNTPYSFERARLNLSADVDVLESVRVSAGYDRTELDREFQEVSEQTEDSGWGRVRWRANGYVDVNVRAGAAKREIDEFNESVLVANGQNPLLRKYNLAHRFREFADVLVSASLPDLPISLSASYAYADDDYSKSELGLLASEDHRFGADLNWALNERTSLYLHGGYETVDATQAGSESFAAPDWRARHDDNFYTVGFGANVLRIADRVDLRFDYVHGEGSSEIVVEGPAAGGTSRFPDLESTLDTVRLSAVYRWSDQLEAILQLRYESFETLDWALAGVEPDTIPAVLTLGADPYDYDVTVVGLGFRFYFGRSEIAQTEE